MRITRTFPLAAIVAMTSVVAPVFAAAGIDGAAIVRGAGRSRLDGAHSWRDTITGDILAAGLTVQASPEQPLEMTLPDGVTIELDPGAMVHWLSASKLPSETNRWTHGYHLILEDGELEVRMPPAPKGTHAFLVSTRAGTLTDWRGQLHAMVHGDTCAAAIYEGALVVGSNGQGFPVYDGGGILIRKGIDPEKARPIPAPPQWLGGPGGLAIIPSGAHASLSFAWSPVPGAASYRIEIAKDKTMVRVVSRASTTEPQYTTSDPGPETQYWVHVRSVGAEGIVGEWSTPRPLRIVRYAVPEGAFVAADGAIVLPSPQASIALPDADGLEVAYENTSAYAGRVAVPLYWAKVTGPLRLPEDATGKIVHLREATQGANGSETRLVLSRRQLRADVILSPKGPRWPTDPLDARVILRDPSSRIDLANEPATIEATLGLVPLPITWTRAGAMWTTRIAPLPIPGPSVVRVVVKDAVGAEIGRSFVEISP
jgi:hypothetical protein